MARIEFQTYDGPPIRVMAPNGQGAVETAVAVDTDEGWIDVAVIQRFIGIRSVLLLAKPGDPSGAPVIVRVYGAFTVESRP